ncbi:MAG: hypothetical protein B6D43_07650 [Ignavibacteriales bacterium UTCHB1]|nr:MAG: hypothetical protein B6D43_07650 [Ignavibacteriales bacterium UTCHB1]
MTTPLFTKLKLLIQVQIVIIIHIIVLTLQVAQIQLQWVLYFLGVVLIAHTYDRFVLKLTIEKFILVQQVLVTHYLQTRLLEYMYMKP